MKPPTIEQLLKKHHDDLLLELPQLADEDLDYLVIEYKDKKGSGVVVAFKHYSASSTEKVGSNETVA